MGVEPDGHVHQGPDPMKHLDEAEESDQKAGIITFFCNTPEERDAIFDEVDALLDKLPNTFHMFETRTATLSTPKEDPGAGKN